jgi:ribosome-associated protein
VVTKSPPTASRGQRRDPPSPGRVPEREIEFRASRAGGPGGQHVNKTATKVELRWNARDSTAIDEETRARLLATLAGRLDADGTLRVVSAGSRSQSANREEALHRLQAIVAKALAPRKKRRPTRPSTASKARRMEAKKKRGATKRMRGRISET